MCGCCCLLHWYSVLHHTQALFIKLFVNNSSLSYPKWCGPCNIGRTLPDTTCVSYPFHCSHKIPDKATIRMKGLFWFTIWAYKSYEVMTGKAWQQGCLVAGHFASLYNLEADEWLAVHVSFLFSLELQPMGWCHPQRSLTISGEPLW